MHSNKLIVIHVLSSLEVGGAERFVIDLSVVQRESGWHPIILSFGSPEDTLEAVCRDLNIPVLRGGRKTISAFVKLHRDLAAADVVHIHTPAVLKPLSIQLPFLRNARIIYTRHGADRLNDRRWKYVHWIARKYVNVVTFVSDEGLQNFMSTFDWADKTRLVIENGVSIPQSSADIDGCDRLRLGVVGRMVPLKHQKTLLNAISALDDIDQSRLSVDFYGDGECRQDLEDYACQRLEKCTIFFHGNVSDRQRIFGNMDLLVVTSETEGLSIAMLEAMAFGIPVIATRVGGNPRLVIDGVTGRLFEFDDSARLAELLSEILKSPLVLDHWGKAARERTAEHFSLKKTAEKYDALYADGDTQ